MTRLPGKMARRLLPYHLSWVKLPARLKMMQLRHQAIAAVQILKIVRGDGLRIRIIAGAVNGLQGPVTDIAADPTYLDVTVPPHAVFRYPIPRGHTAFAYPLGGQGAFAPETREAIRSPNLVVWGDGDQVAVRTVEHAVRFLLVSSRPLGKPIAHYGPFVMNTTEEIERALRDLCNGTFV